MRTIQDVTEPVLFESFFPHVRPPSIPFDGPITEVLDGETVTIDPSDLRRRDLCITDTTFRDGQQARMPYTVEQIVALFDLMATLSGPNGVIRQTEFFLYNKKDREAVERCRERGHRYPEITSWIRADAGDLKLVKTMGIRETGMLTSCSDYHIFMKQKMTRRQALESYTGIVKEALSHGIRPRCHLEDVTRADIDGFVLPYVEALMRISQDAGDDLGVKIRLCDTMGFGVPYPGAALPRSVPKLVLSMLRKAGVPSERLEWHGHNDFHKALVNGVTAWITGCDALNGTFLGIGERTGNPPVEGALMEYIGLKGEMNGIDTRAITDMANFYRSIGTRISIRYPFVGDDFHKTRAGIHAGGLASNERIYNIFDTGALLDRPPEVVITDKSGTDGVHLWVNNFLDRRGAAMIKKTKLIRIMRWVSDQYEVENRGTAISDQEMAEKVKEFLPREYEEAARNGNLVFTHQDG